MEGHDRRRETKVPEAGGGGSGPLPTRDDWLYEATCQGRHTQRQEEEGAWTAQEKHVSLQM